MRNVVHKMWCSGSAFGSSHAKTKKEGRDERNGCLKQGDLKCSFKITSAVAGFFPFSHNNLLLTLIISYYQQPSRPSLDNLKESDFGNTS